MDVKLDSACSVADVWKQVAVDSPADQVLCAVNQEFSSDEQQVKDGDEVAFFPPVTGG
jgi:molybdopterin synthase sulfur carrier subunit